jgi:glycosyltransferase involved in cell wall biosynthesis
MKIAIVSHSPHMTGAEKMLINLSNSFQRNHGIEVHIFAYGVGQMKKEAIKKGLYYHSLNNLLPWYICVHDELDSVRTFWYYTSKSTEELVLRFRELGIECVIINTLTTLSGMLAASRLNIPSVLWIHGIIDHMLVPQSGEYFKMACDRLLINSATAVICPSNWVKDHYSFFRDDINVIPNFTNVPERPLNFPDGITTFSCLNTWDHHKGMEILIAAAKILKEDNQKFKLNFFGDGTLKEHLRKMIYENQLTDCVFLQNRVDDITDIFANTHALVNASQIESFGMTLIEAMAHGRPIIVSDTSGHKEILEDNNYGFFCMVNKPESFAEKMKWVIHHRDEAYHMGLKGYSVAKKKFDGREVSKKFTEIIEDVLEREPTIRLNDLLNRYILCDTFYALLDPMNKYSINEREYLDENNNTLIGNPQVPIVINNEVQYIIPVPIDKFKNVSFIIGTHNKKVRGDLILKIFDLENDKLLRESKVNLIEIEDNSWVTFNFNCINGIKDKNLKLKLIANTDDLISVYETSGLNIIGKIMNKLKPVRFSENVCCKLG